MLKVFLQCAALAVCTGCGAVALAQTSFEVASIRPSQAAVAFEHDGSTEVAHGTLRMRDVTVLTCIKWAYQVQLAQVIGLPGKDQQHYDIVAKADPGTTMEQMRPMLQALLAERFGLAFHHDRRELNAYALVVDPKGLKISPSATPDGELYRQNSDIGMVARNMTMKEFADNMADPLGAPLADETHLAGKYNLSLDFRGHVDEDREHQATPASILDSTFRSELGLQLVRRKSVFDVMVIDHVEAPTPN